MQLALLLMLVDDADPDVAMTALSTVQGLPLEPLRAFLARGDVPSEIREFFGSMGITPAEEAAPDASEPLTVDGEDEEAGPEAEEKDGAPSEPKLLAGLPIMRTDEAGDRRARASSARS